MRQLEESSWLAQIIVDKMEVEFDKNGASNRYNCLQTLLIIVREADNPDNIEIYHDTYNGKRSITICDIKPMYEYGMDFDSEGMRCKLRGLALSYKDDNGMYLVSVLTTNDLNSAMITDLNNLMFQLSAH